MGPIYPILDLILQLLLIPVLLVLLRIHLNLVGLGPLLREAYLALSLLQPVQGFPPLDLGFLGLSLQDSQ